MNTLQLAEIVLGGVGIWVAVLLARGWSQKRSLDIRLLGFLGLIGTIFSYRESLAFLLPVGIAVYGVCFFRTYSLAFREGVLWRDALDDLFRLTVAYWIVLFFNFAYRLFTLLVVGGAAMLVVLSISYRFAKVVDGQEA